VVGNSSPSATVSTLRVGSLILAVSLPIATLTSGIFCSDCHSSFTSCELALCPEKTVVSINSTANGKYVLYCSLVGGKLEAAIHECTILLK
jgi:hypothetical protein